jgi:hypothetical protein
MRMVRSETEPSAPYFTAPTRSISSPKPERMPAAFMAW